MVIGRTCEEARPLAGLASRPGELQVLGAVDLHVDEAVTALPSDDGIDTRGG
jgi:hypothetical protein